MLRYLKLPPHDEKGNMGRISVYFQYDGVPQMIPGLWGEGTVSFESSLEPGFYLRARGDTMWVEQARA